MPSSGAGAGTSASAGATSIDLRRLLLPPGATTPISSFKSLQTKGLKHKSFLSLGPPRGSPSLFPFPRGF
jgi:hypothetical protein